ncbi:hypothetical protein RQP46_011144 [Phenoliferia psychrophenolica]
MPPRKSNASNKRAATQDSGSESGEGTDYENANNKAPKKKGGAAAKKGGKGAAAKKRAAQAGSDEEEGGGDDDDDDAPVAKGKGKEGAPMSDDLRQKLIMEMARHALYCEMNRKPFRSEDVRKTILVGGHSRHFNEFLGKAQKHLRNGFGMELVPMRAKEGASGKAPLKAWTLRSTLPLPRIRALATQDDDLLPHQGELLEAPDNDAQAIALHEFRREEGYARDIKREEGGAYGVLGVILGLILVSGKVLGEDQLVVYLRKLNLDLQKPIPASLSARPIPKEDGLTLQKYLTNLASQGYLEKGKSGTGPQATQGKSQKNATQSGDPGVEWRWGARAESEFGEAGIARFVQEIYEAKPDGGREEDDEDGEEVLQKRAKGQTGEKLLTEIARASGNVNLAEATAVKGHETE